jgi:hypothetical protein
MNILLSSTDKIIITICYRLQIKPQEEETARHQDTRAVSGGTPAAQFNMHRKYKRFLGKYSITYQRHKQIPIKDFAVYKVLFHLFANS